VSPTAPDPLGKQALYWSSGPPADGPPPLGKQALFSGATAAGRGSVQVECSRCGSVRRVGVVEFLRLQLPLALWLPGRTFDRKMTCPTCRRRSWVSVTFRR
jgi:hypothetical protein